MIVEIRTYRVRSNTADEFVHLMTTLPLPLPLPLPLLAEHDITVLDCGLSLDSDGEPQADAYLIRTFRSLAEREAQEAGFYGSDAWTRGPREPVLALIENFHTIVLELPADTTPADAAAGLGSASTRPLDPERSGRVAVPGPVRIQTHPMSSPGRHPRRAQRHRARWRRGRERGAPRPPLARG